MVPKRKRGWAIFFRVFRGSPANVKAIRKDKINATTRPFGFVAAVNPIDSPASTSQLVAVWSSRQRIRHNSDAVA